MEFPPAATLIAAAILELTQSRRIRLDGAGLAFPFAGSNPCSSPHLGVCEVLEPGAWLVARTAAATLQRGR